MAGSVKTPSQWDSENSPVKAQALASIPSVEIAVGVEVPNVINVTLQVIDAQGMALALRLAFIAWLSDTPGVAVTSAAPSGGTSIGTDGVIIFEHVAETIFELITDADGALDLDIEEAAADTWYLNVRLPGGAIVSSAAIAF
jgi:hypothetical protein